MPTYEQVRAGWQPSDVILLAADGTRLQRMRTDFSARRGDWLPLGRISAALQNAVIQSEDRRFQEHAGVDWLASAAAAWSSLTGDGRRGASTISMQLVAMLDSSLQRGSGGRGVVQKFEQMQAARLLEQQWSKTQILEAYLNLASFRGELVGADTLARVLFRKQASGLTLREAAVAAALLRGPNATPSLLAQRSCALLQAMGQAKYCADLQDFVAVSLARAGSPGFGSDDLAPHWARHMLEKAKTAAVESRVLQSTLDAALQTRALQTVRQQLADLRGTGATDAAVVVLENDSGAVLAYVGSSGSLSAAPEVDHARALRQAGSTLKPFLYALALDQQRLTAASLLDDSPLDLQGGSGLYVPDNYDHSFAGWVSVRMALASSLNIPAVRTLLMVGPDALARHLVDLGLPLQHGGDFYGYSLALGSADVSLLSLSNAYRALARGGVYTEISSGLPGVIYESAAGKQLVSAQAAWIVGDILADRQARARTFGLDSPLSMRFHAAVKTGTSRDMRDNWCVGWSADYTVGVWVGNSAGASMRNISGVSGACPIWHDLLAWLHEHRRQQTTPLPPQGIVRSQVSFAPGLEPSRIEYFMGDTAQQHFAPATVAALAGLPRIVEPVDGSLLALDPDIPLARQMLRLRAMDASSLPVADARWFVNGRFYARDTQVQWPLAPGNHVIELRSETGQVLDRARISVRPGSFLKKPLN